ncbi:MAG TPA: hypothetical protein VLA82_01115 [Actinomycetota bacterium]|nr:hypothetical protein [Actinomycetota bacterium]
MRHPDEGLLRRLLDEPAGVAAPDREHVAGCERCLAEVGEIRRDAELVRTALATDLEPDVDLTGAWHRLTTSADGVRSPSAATPIGRRRGRTLRRPVVVAVAAALVMTGAGAAAANGWLEIFRTERIAAVSFDPADLNALPDLAAYGDVAVTGDPEIREVTTRAAAETATGLGLPEPTTLPSGVDGAPTYHVADEVSVTFTFSADRVEAAAADAGEELPPLPADLDGTRVRLSAGPGAAAVWPHASGVPALIVGRAVAPTASSTSGVTFETMRDVLLSLPGVPDDVARALRTFNADGSTLPLPVPADQVETSSADVDGDDATVFRTRDGTVAAVAWVDDGVMTVVAGPLGDDEVLAVARSLE